MENIIRNLTFGKAVLVGLLLTGLYWMLMYDNGEKYDSEIQVLKNKQTTNNAEINRISRAIEDAKLFEQTMAQLGEEMTKIQTAIPRSFSSVDLLKLISTIAKDLGSSIESISDASGNARPAADAIYVPITVSVSLLGTYNQMMTFLSALTKSDKLLTVENLTLTSRTSGPNSTPSIQMMTVIKGYQYNDPGEKK